MIEVVQELTQKRFGFTRKRIDKIEKEKIDSAKLKVERFFNKLYGNK